MLFFKVLIFIQINSFNALKYQFRIDIILCSIQQDWKFQYIWDQ